MCGYRVGKLLLFKTSWKYQPIVPHKKVTISYQPMF